MRRLIIAAFTVLSSVSLASAAPIAYDGFNYTVGNSLRGSGGWSTAATGSVGTTPRPTIVSGSLSYPGLTASTGNSVQLTNANGAADRLPIGTNTTGSIYYSMIVRLGDKNAGTNTGGAFFAGLDSNATGSTFANIASVYTRLDNGNASATDFNLGLRTGSTASIFWSPAVSPNQDLFVVGSYTFGGQSTMDIYVSPAAFPMTEPGSHQLVAPADATATSAVAFFLRQNTGEPSAITVDELRIGTSWADVAVPEPTSAGPVIVSTLGLLARRRRK